MKDRDEIIGKISEILGDLLEIDDLVLSADSSADDFAEWDSVNHVRLLIGLEREYGFEFATNEVGMVENVGELATLVQKKME